MSQKNILSFFKTPLKKVETDAESAGKKGEPTDVKSAQKNGHSSAKTPSPVKNKSTDDVKEPKVIQTSTHMQDKAIPSKERSQPFHVWQLCRIEDKEDDVDENSTSKLGKSEDNEPQTKPMPDNCIPPRKTARKRAKGVIGARQKELLRRAAAGEKMFTSSESDHSDESPEKEKESSSSDSSPVKTKQPRTLADKIRMYQKNSDSSVKSEKKQEMNNSSKIDSDEVQMSEESPEKEKESSSSDSSPVKTKQPRTLADKIRMNQKNSDSPVKSEKKQEMNNSSKIDSDEVQKSEQEEEDKMEDDRNLDETKKVSKQNNSTNSGKTENSSEKSGIMQFFSKNKNANQKGSKPIPIVESGSPKSAENSSKSKSPKVEKRKRNSEKKADPVEKSPATKKRVKKAKKDSSTKSAVKKTEGTDSGEDEPMEASDDSADEVVRPVKRGRKNVIVDSPVKKKRKEEEKDDDNGNIKNGKNKVQADDIKEEENAQADDIKDEEKAQADDVKEEEKAQADDIKEDKKEQPKKTIHSFFAPKAKKSDSETPDDKKKDKSAITGETYNPQKSNYHPIDDACWKRNEKVPYLALARTLEEIEAISARLKMIEILANFLRSVIVLSPDDLLYSVYLCLNRIAPEYEGVEMGVGETILMKALGQATGRTLDKIKAEVATKGDLGSVAETSRGTQRVMFAFPKLTVSSVFAKFKEIALMSGNAAMAKKTDKIQALFSACRQCEARYIIRSLSGKLRIGLAEQSILTALAQAAVLTPPNQDFPPDVINASSGKNPDSFKKVMDSQVLILKTSYCECPNYDLIIPILLKEGISELPNHCQLMAGVPLKPMLAHPTKGIDEVLRRFTDNSGESYEFTCEFKYDGERAQIHLTEEGDVKIYSRSQENNTSKYPDVVKRLEKSFKTKPKSFILDSEAVAWNKETNEILPFQILSTRKRKDAADSEIKVQVCIMAFDLLYLNGESLVKKPLRERRSLLKETFCEVPGEFSFAQSMDGNAADIMQDFLEESIRGKCEGLMVKSLVVDATYEIAKRSRNWLKLKKDYLEGVGDTLDLVVIGAWFGKGKRTGNYGGFLLACYDMETEEYQTICKLGTGFKESDLDAHTKFLKEKVVSTPRSDYRYDSSLEPDVWFDAVQVWEIKCADLSISPTHKAAAGLVDPEKGISLRFPRFLRIRDDKKVENATTSKQVAEMYNKQDQVQNQKSTVDDEDFY